MLIEETATAYLQSLREKLVQARKTTEIATTLMLGHATHDLIALEEQFIREAEADRRYVEARAAFCRARTN